MSTSEVRIGQLGIRYILDGSATNSIGLFELTVPPGSNVPPPHSHSRNEECTSVAHALIVQSPDIGEQYFRDIASVANADGPPDKAALVEVMSKYGLTPAAPSAAPNS